MIKSDEESKKDPTEYKRSPKPLPPIPSYRVLTYKHAVELVNQNLRISDTSIQTNTSQILDETSKQLEELVDQLSSTGFNVTSPDRRGSVHAMEVRARSNTAPTFGNQTFNRSRTSSALSSPAKIKDTDLSSPLGSSSSSSRRSSGHGSITELSAFLFPTQDTVPYRPAACYPWAKQKATKGSFFVFHVPRTDFINLTKNSKKLSPDTVHILEKISKQRDNFTKMMTANTERTIPEIEEYIPYILGLKSAWEEAELRQLTRCLSPPKSRIAFGWSSSVIRSNSQLLFNEMPHYDAIMTINIYGYLLANLASYAIYGNSNDDVDTEVFRNFQVVNESINLLQKASGLFWYNSVFLISNWKTLNLLNRTPETFPEISTTLSRLCLAEAQITYCFHLYSQPIGNDHVLLSRLWIGIHESLNVTINSLRNSRFKFSEFRSSLRNYFNFFVSYSHSQCLKHMGLFYISRNQIGLSAPYFNKSFQILKDMPLHYKSRTNRLGRIRKKLKKEIEQLIKDYVKKPGILASLLFGSRQDYNPSTQEKTLPLFEPLYYIQLMFYQPPEPFHFRILGKKGKDMSLSPLATRKFIQDENTNTGKLFDKIIREKTGLMKWTSYNILNQQTPMNIYFLVFCDGFLLVYDRPEESKKDWKDMKPIRVLAIDGCSVERETSAFSFKITISNKSRLLTASNTQDMEDWILVFRQSGDTRRYPYGSFCDERLNTNCKFYIDGEDYFDQLVDSFLSAKKEIMISDWFLVPEIFLRRKHDSTSADRLDRILKRKAQEGVKIYILLWNEPSIVINLKSWNTKRKLEEIHENIMVVRHPPLEPLNWSHHQKIVVIDQEIAFIGGLDLCFGRWDTNDHVIIDNCHLDCKWPGKDYYNPMVKAFSNVDKPFDDPFDRVLYPRMAWHDVQMSLDGQSAFDVSYNFIQRWNHHKDSNYPLLFPLFPYKEKPQPTGTCKTQILRSICDWSGGNRREYSIYRAYIDIIEKAQHFIYIENQFFISSTSENGTTIECGSIQNMIADAILQKIRNSIKSKRVFRVIIVLPIHPDSNYRTLASTRYIMKWQYDTISRGENSLIEKLKREFPNIDIRDYITFHSLRKCQELAGKLVTEQIYVHSKIMIVDDLFCIIGSANINDRSLCGDRDSEIAVLVKDQDFLNRKMNGQPFKVSKFAHDLRVKLWAEHLGLLNQKENKWREKLEDPVDDETYKRTWVEISDSNTKIYEYLFNDIPSDKISRLDQIQSDICISTLYSGQNLNSSDIRGHLVNHPLYFLKDEDLSPSAKNSPFLKLDPSIFQ